MMNRRIMLTVIISAMIAGNVFAAESPDDDSAIYSPYPSQPQVQQETQPVSPAPKKTPAKKSAPKKKTPAKKYATKKAAAPRRKSAPSSIMRISQRLSGAHLSVQLWV